MAVFHAGLFDEIGEDVALKMVDLDQWLAQCDGKALGERCTHKQRAQKAGASCKGYCRDILGLDSCPCNCLAHNWYDVQLMCS